MNVTSRSTFRKKLKKDFDYDERSGLQTIAVPGDARGLDGTFQLRERGLPSFWIVDIHDDWKIIYHSSAGRTNGRQESCAIPRSKKEHGAYIDRMTNELSSALDAAMAGTTTT